MEVSLHPSPTVKLISPSRISVFQACPKKYDYIYEQELVSKEPSKLYFNKGNYFHELSHVYYELIKAGMMPGSDYAVAQIIARIRNDVEKLTDPKLLPVYGVISKRIVRFIKEQSPKIDSGITVLHVEHELMWPLPDGKSLFGYADLVYRDNQGNLRLRDHKTGDKAWKKGDAQNSNQLLFYAVILYKLLGEIPIAEISYINTKDQIKPMAFDSAFTHSTVSYSKRELEIYFEEICKLIEDMVKSRPIPYYGNHCGYCAYRIPCMAERKGIDPTPLILSNFRKVPRDSQRKHPSFSEQTSNEDSDGDGTD